MGLRAAGYGANSLIYSGSIPYILARYAFVYANFGPAKLSVGKLYDELLPVQGSRVWKSEGPGDSHRFTDEENYSVRLEVKPIEGLNVGAQFFFPLIEDFRIDGRDPISGYYEKGLDETDAWKEIGLGASYTSGLFNAQLGVRFDSNADRFGSQDSGPQANGGYLPLYYGQFSLLSAGVKADVYDYVRGDGFKTPQLKHKDKIIGVTGKDYQGQDVIGYLPYDGGTYAFFGFNFKGVENLAVRAHGGLYNLGAFDEFGYGRFSEDIKYNNLIGGLSIGITMQQEFYGSDVWPDTMVNSPFLQFGPQVSYAIITMPQMPMPVLQATLDTSFGFCQDVLDLYAKVKPSMTLSLGVFMVDLFYELEYSGFTEKAVIKPMTRHTVGLAAMLVF